VVRVWMMLEAEVVVDGRPEMDVRTESLAPDVELVLGEPGRRETNVILGYVVCNNVCATACELCQEGVLR